MTDENNSILQNEVADNTNEQEKKKCISLTLEEKIKLEEKIFLEQKKRLQILKREQRMIEIGAFVESYLGTTTAEDAIKKITKFCPAAKPKSKKKSTTKAKVALKNNI